MLFNRAWMRANGFSEADLQKGNAGIIFGLAFLFSRIIAANLAAFLATPDTTWAWGAAARGLTAVWVALGSRVSRLRRHDLLSVFQQDAAKSMHALFVAAGPAFRSNVVVPPFENVHVYALMCHVLGITPAPHDGDESVGLAMLAAGAAAPEPVPVNR